MTCTHTGRIDRQSLSITPQPHKQVGTYSTAKHKRNFYQTHNMIGIPSIQIVHNFLSVLPSMPMRPLKMIQISFSVQICNPLDPILIAFIEHFHSLFHGNFTQKYHINNNHFTLSPAASAAAAYQTPHSHQIVAAVVHDVRFLSMIHEIAMNMRRH